MKDLTTDQLTTTVLQSVCDFFEECMPKINHCLGQLSDEQVWWRPREEMNSIGNLLLHLSGNVKQRSVSGLGSANDVRNPRGILAAPSDPESRTSGPAGMAGVTLATC